MASTKEKNCPVICIDLTNDDEDYIFENSERHPPRDIKDITSTLFTQVVNSTGGSSKITDKKDLDLLDTKVTKYFKRKGIREHYIRNKKQKTTSNAATALHKLGAEYQKDTNLLKEQVEAIFLKMQNNEKLHPNLKDLESIKNSFAGDIIQYEVFPVTKSEIECLVRISRATPSFKDSKKFCFDGKISNVTKHLELEDNEMDINDSEAGMIEEKDSESDVKIIYEWKVLNETALKYSVTSTNQEADPESSANMSGTVAPEQIHSPKEGNSSNEFDFNNRMIINESGLITDESFKASNVENDLSVSSINCLESEKMSCPVTLLNIEVSEDTSVTDSVINNEEQKHSCIYNCKESNLDRLISNVTSPEMYNTEGKCNFNVLNPEKNLDANDGLEAEKKQCSNIDNTEAIGSILLPNVTVEEPLYSTETDAVNDQMLSPGRFWIKNHCGSENSFCSLDFNVAKSNSSNIEKVTYQSYSETSLPYISDFNQEFIEKEERFNDQILVNESELQNKNASKEERCNDQILVNEFQNFWEQEKCFSCTEGICKHVISNISQNFIKSTPDMSYSNCIFKNASELNQTNDEISNVKNLNNVQNIINEDSMNQCEGALKEKLGDVFPISDEIMSLISTGTVANDAVYSGTRTAYVNQELQIADRCNELENNTDQSLYENSKNTGCTLKDPHLGANVDSNGEKRLYLLQNKVMDRVISEPSGMEFREFTHMQPVSNAKGHPGDNSSHENNEIKKYESKINLTDSFLNSIDLNVEELRKTVDAVSHLKPIFNSEISSLNENSWIKEYNSAQNCVSFSTESVKQNSKDVNEDISSGISQKSGCILFDGGAKILKNSYEVTNTTVPKELNMNGNTSFSSTDTQFVCNEINVIDENFPHIGISTDFDVVKGPDALKDKRKNVTCISPSYEMEFYTQIQNSNVALNSTESGNLPAGQMLDLNVGMTPSDLKVNLLKPVINSIDINVQDLQNVLEAVKHLESPLSSGSGTLGKCRLLNEKCASQQCLSHSPENPKHSNTDVREYFIFPPTSRSGDTISLDNDEKLMRKGNELTSTTVRNEILQHIGQEGPTSSNARSIDNEICINKGDSAFTSITDNLHALRFDSLQDKPSECMYKSLSSEKELREFNPVQNCNSSHKSSFINKTGHLSNEINESNSKINLTIPAMANSDIFSVEKLKNLLNAVKHLTPVVSSSGQEERRELKTMNEEHRNSDFQSYPELANSHAEKYSFCQEVSDNVTNSKSDITKLTYGSSASRIEKTSMQSSGCKGFSVLGSSDSFLRPTLELTSQSRSDISQNMLMRLNQQSVYKINNADNYNSSFEDLRNTGLGKLNCSWNNSSTFARDVPTDVVNDSPEVVNDNPEGDLCYKRDYIYKWLEGLEPTSQDSSRATQSIKIANESNKIFPEECHSILNCTDIHREESDAFGLFATALSCTANSHVVPMNNLLPSSEIENKALSMKVVFSPMGTNSSSTLSEKGQLSFNNEEKLSNTSEKHFSVTGRSETPPSISLSREIYPHTGNKETRKEAKPQKVDIIDVADKNICLVPKQFKSYVGHKILETERVLWLMLEWRVSWFKEQSKTDSPPPICKILKPVENSYGSFEKYYNTYFPLMLVDTWHRLYISWREMKNSSPYLCEITSHFNRNQYLKIECQTVVGDHPKRQFLKEGKIAIITFGSNKQESSMKMFGYLTQVRPRPFNRASDSKLQSYKHLKDGKKKNLKVLRLSIKVAYNLGQYDLTLPISVQILCNIKTILKQNDAMLYMQKSPLFKNILSPVKDVQNFELNSSNGDSEKDFKSVADIAQSISISYPIPSLVAVRYKFDSDRLRIIPLLVENLKDKYESKVLLCERSLKTLNVVAESICERKSLNMVIALHRCEVEKHLEKYLLSERVASEMKKKELDDDCFSVNARLSRVRRTIVQECDVILVLIRNSYDSPLSETVSNSVSLAHFCCIVDEANLCPEAEALIPIMHGFSKLILMGDTDYDAKTLSTTARNFQYHKSFFHRVRNLHMASK